MDLHVVWFGLLGILLAGYAVLDGFDLGVGILHPLARSDEERRTFVNAIGPLWDGNEVWLVTFGGALFAMFPEAYATVFSGFYLAFMLLLFALILRAVSLEFRSKLPHGRWRGAWLPDPWGCGWPGPEPGAWRKPALRPAFGAQSWDGGRAGWVTSEETSAAI